VSLPSIHVDVKLSIVSLSLSRIVVFTRVNPG